ncbi:MAG: tetratricopeptide repeat protein [Deltaproteobacteria bacterium]|nr:tetratricopeptide repeat protein [Deltaproteobacteria bacterium]
MRVSEALLEGRYRVLDTCPTHLVAEDTHSGGHVWIHQAPTYYGGSMMDPVAREAQEATARVVATLGLAGAVPVLGHTPRVVLAAPTEGPRSTTPLDPRGVAHCALDVCVVLARLHAEGWTGLRADTHDVLVAHDGARWRARVLLPHLAPRRGIPYAVGFHRDPWWCDVKTVALLAADLSTGTAPEARGWFKLGVEPSSVELPEGFPPPLREVLRGTWSAPTPLRSAGALAQALVPWVPEREAEARALPQGPPRALAHDWDRLIALCEDALGTPCREHRDLRSWAELMVGCGLAGALHQRAVVALARGDAGAALADVQRALSLAPSWGLARVTHVLALDAAGRHAQALELLDRALPDLDPKTDPEEDFPYGPGEGFDAMRARYTRSVFRLRDGDAAGALDDLWRAEWLASDLREDTYTRIDLEPGALAPPPSCQARWTPPASHFARVRVRATRELLREGALEAVLRWPYIDALLVLGHREEAHAEARALVAASPGDPKVARAYARRFPD